MGNATTEAAVEPAATEEAKKKKPRGDKGCSLKRLRAAADKHGYEVLNGTRVPAIQPIDGGEAVPAGYTIDLFRGDWNSTFRGASAREAYAAALAHIRADVAASKKVEDPAEAAA